MKLGSRWLPSSIYTRRALDNMLTRCSARLVHPIMCLCRFTRANHAATCRRMTTMLALAIAVLLLLGSKEAQAVRWQVDNVTATAGERNGLGTTYNEGSSLQSWESLLDDNKDPQRKLIQVKSKPMDSFSSVESSTILFLHVFKVRDLLVTLPFFPCSMLCWGFSFRGKASERHEAVHLIPRRGETYEYCLASS